LLWKDEFGWYDTVTTYPYGRIEARWTDQGATCLNTPRVDYNWTPLGSDAFPDGVEPELDPSAGWCEVRPPMCDGLKSDLEGTHLISVNF